ncbi:hypothetical protein IAT40_000605 [Kwoniella sp. CBS 6097]
MQPQPPLPTTPTPLHRTVHPVPSSASRRPPFSSRFTSTWPSTSSNHNSNSFLRLFVGALAVTASKSWVLDDPRQLGGGVGWLVVAFWAGKVIGELREIFGDSRRKNKEAGTSSHTQNQTLLSVLLAVQTVSFFMALQAVGPLRIAIVALAATIPNTTSLTSFRTLGPTLPILASTIIIIGQLATQDAISLIAIAVFAGTTLQADRTISQIARFDRTRGGDDKIKEGRGRTAGGWWECLVSTSTALALIFILSTSSIISIPLPISQVPGQRFASFITGLLVRYIPFPFTSSSSTSSTSKRNSVLRLRSPRDKVLFLTTIPVLQFFALHPIPTSIDLLVLLPMSLFSILAATATDTSRPGVEGSAWSFPNKSLSTSKAHWSFMSLLPARWRPHFQTILNTPTSSKIFYFLLLNLAYMFVQMVYGVFTNSLGLISDAIHMLFDCLGLAVGLWASVAATWKPDGRYTFGYSRVETLSGFANGCFLILISIFIIFEGIQRVLDPPEMETHQLLLVSGIGLAINLWGMYATGGHHHHGHGHGHDHGHGHSHGHAHSHAPIPVNDKKTDHRHDDKHDHHRSESQGPSQSSSTRPERTLAKRRSSGFLRAKAQPETPEHKVHDHPHTHHDHDHDHHDHSACNGRDHAHSQGHSHEYHDHAHAHAHDHGHDHNHDCAQSHDHHSYSHDHNHDHDHDHGHDDHGHGHDHAHSHNMRGVFLHVLADTLGSVGVIISTILIRFTGWTGFDPIASLFIAVLIMASVIPLVIDSGRVLCLDVGNHKEEEIRKALTELSTIDGVANYASPRFWPRCEGELVGSIHIQLAPSKSAYDPTRFSTPYLNKPRSGDVIYANSDKVISRVEKVLKKKIRGLTELVVQVEGSEDKGYCTCMTGTGPTGM